MLTPFCQDRRKKLKVRRSKDDEADEGSTLAAVATSRTCKLQTSKHVDKDMDMDRRGTGSFLGKASYAHVQHHVR